MTHSFIWSVGVLIENEAREKLGLNPESFLLRKADQFFYNTSPLDLKMLMSCWIAALRSQ